MSQPTNCAVVTASSPLATNAALTSVAYGGGISLLYPWADGKGNVCGYGSDPFQNNNQGGGGNSGNNQNFVACVPVATALQWPTACGTVKPGQNQPTFTVCAAAFSPGGPGPTIPPAQSAVEQCNLAIQNGFVIGNQ